jgi:hypothetical protein
MLDGHEHHAEATAGGGYEPSRGTDDPILMAVRRAPRMSPDVAARCRALVAEVKSDPSTWQSEEQFMAKIAALAPRGSE